MPWFHTSNVIFNEETFIIHHVNHWAWRKDSLMKSIDNRFGSIMKFTEENKSLFISSACHPLFKLSWLPEEDCDIVKSWLRIALQNNDQDVANQSTISDIPTNTYFIRYARQNTAQLQNNELERFLEIQDESVDMLHEYPNIKTLFIDTNTTLSSSGGIERMFSQASLIFQPRRNRLSSTNFERAMFLKINGSIPSNKLE